MGQAALPRGDRRLDASQAQLDVAALLGDPQQRRILRIGKRGRRLVVGERFAVREQRRRGVAGGLAELESLRTQLGEL